MNPALAKLPKSPKLPAYDAMIAAINRCESVEDAKGIRDKALALAAWAKQAQNREAERKCIRSGSAPNARQANYCCVRPRTAAGAAVTATKKRSPQK